MRKGLFMSEIYMVARGLALPVSRQLVFLWLKRGKLHPVGKYLGQYLFRTDEVVSLLISLATSKHRAIFKSDILTIVEKELENGPFFSNFINSVVL